MIATFLLPFLAAAGLAPIPDPSDTDIDQIDQNLYRPIQVIDYFASQDSYLTVNCAVENIAYEKQVKICDYTNFKDCRAFFPCTYADKLNGTFEKWTCKNKFDRQSGYTFVAKYLVSGREYNDLGPNGTGYQVYLPPLTSTVTPTAPSISSASQKTTITRSTSTTVPSVLPGCQTYNGMDSCNGDQVDYDPSVESRRWQTPNKTDSNYTPSFQDYSSLTGYTDIIYSPDRKSATITVKTFTKVPNIAILCSFGGAPFQSDCTFQASSTSTSKGPLTIKCKTIDESAFLELDDFYFFWDMPSVTRPETKDGQKGAIVELMGWPYKDIALECEFLGKAGYMGLRVFAPNEHVMSDEWLEPDGNFNPWYFSYQPVSYRLISRQGTLEELRQMITTCRQFGVRVFADAVVNHMTGNGIAINRKRNQEGGSRCVYWGPHNSSAGSPYFTHGYSYEFDSHTNQRPALEFPAVPFGPLDFHCERSLSSYTSGFVLSNGWLSGLADLNTGREYVQDRIATYFATLLSVGFSGFRLDAAKHISPDHLAAIFSKLSKKMGGSLPVEFIAYLEVLLGGEKNLLACDYGNYNYYSYFSDALKRAGLTENDVGKIKIWSSDYPKEFPVCGKWIIPSERFVIQNDDHDQQNPGSSSRDMQNYGSVLIVSKDIQAHRKFEVELFSRTDANWQIKQLLSGYYFEVGNANGWPDGKSDCSRYKGNQSFTCKGIPFKRAFQANACGYSMMINGTWQVGEYTRTHRDLSIVNAMRKWMNLSPVGPTDIGLESFCK